MLRPEPNKKTFFATELELLKQHVPVSMRENLPDLIISEFWGDGLDGKGECARYVDGALFYLSNKAAGGDVYDFKAVKETVKSAIQLKKNLDDLLDLMDGSCAGIMKLYSPYAMAEERKNNTGDGLDVARRITGMEKQLPHLRDFIEKWIKEKSPKRGRRPRIALNHFVNHVIHFYENLNGAPAKIYQSKGSDNSFIKGDGAKFLLLSVKMLNRWAKEVWGYKSQYSEDHVYSAYKAKRKK